MSLTATFDPLLSRVRLAGTGLTTGTTALFEHSLNNTKWSTVRGGSAVTISGTDTADLDDYEFAVGVINYYRVKDTTHTFTANVTPSQSGVWFKSISRPFLNRAVTVTNYSDITRPSRNGVFEIVGRSLPVAVTDVRSSRRWEFQIKAETVSDADALELIFDSGDPLFIQTDGVYDIPEGYVVVGDFVRNRFGHVSNRRLFNFSCTEVSAPGPDVYGRTANWETIAAEFATWNDVVAEFSTWDDVTEHVSDPSVVIVS